MVGNGPPVWLCRRTTERHRAEAPATLDLSTLPIARIPTRPSAVVLACVQRALPAHAWPLEALQMLLHHVGKVPDKGSCWL